VKFILWTPKGRYRNCKQRFETIDFFFVFFWNRAEFFLIAAEFMVPVMKEGRRE